MLDGIQDYMKKSWNNDMIPDGFRKVWNGDRMQMYLAVVITKNQMNNESDERNILQNAPAMTVWRAK